MDLKNLEGFIDFIESGKAEEMVHSMSIEKVEGQLKNCNPKRKLTIKKVTSRERSKLRRVYHAINNMGKLEAKLPENICPSFKSKDKLIKVEGNRLFFGKSLVELLTKVFNWGVSALNSLQWIDVTDKIEEVLVQSFPRRPSQTNALSSLEAFIQKTFTLDFFKKVAQAGTSAFLLGVFKGAFDATIDTFFSEASANHIKLLLNFALVTVSVPSIVLFIPALIAAPVPTIICLIGGILASYIGYELGYYFIIKVFDITPVVAEKCLRHIYEVYNWLTGRQDSSGVNQNIPAHGGLPLVRNQLLHPGLPVTQNHVPPQQQAVTRPPLPDTHVHGTEGYLHVGLCITCCMKPASIVFVHDGTLDRDGHAAMCEDCIGKYQALKCPCCRSNCADIYEIVETEIESKGECQECLHVGICGLCRANPPSSGLPQRTCDSWVKEKSSDLIMLEFCKNHAEQTPYPIKGSFLQGGFIDN